MEFGLCAPPERAGLAAQAGYTYIEPGVSTYLQPQNLDTAHLAAFDAALGDSALRPQTFNGFVPAELRIVGPDRDLDALKSYVEVACGRAAMMGGQIIVFGSGKARQVPEGYRREIATSEIGEFLTLCAPIAVENGVMIAIEPLQKRECNILNSVAEAVEMCKLVNRREAIGVSSDLFHVAMENQGFEETETAAREGWLQHVHLACTSDRRAPRAEDRDELLAFFGALKRGGYGARVSIEATFKDLEAEAASGLLVMQEAWQSARA